MNIVSNMAVFSSHREILGLPVCDLGWADAFTFVNALAEVPVGQTVISFMNAHNANVMFSDRGYREALDRHLVLPDGIGVDIASLMAYGAAFPANLNGTDFVPSLLTYMTRPKRIGLIGARPEILLRACRNFEAHAPWHEFIPIHHGYFHEDQSGEILAEAANLKLDILLVAMGTPRQEKWIDRHIHPEHARLVLGVGALFDFVAGEVPRAPMVVRKMRVEWFYRFLQEPRRLAGRYFVGGPLFLWHVIADMASRLAAGNGGKKRSARSRRPLLISNTGKRD
ncbi:exopolysaccharide biosynthesis WecB/TagA/CpsF family protein [Rhizobium sp. SG_E_25_P2]|uniref:WecB/TagA/CpsF family glycosyltransferase n=1 Tax=Rhizobium sp. SG_E_25_P2 TaxID=2879942 RepID=UPI002476C370|nr:WecB/TagA/CpsF family glycosyltransferase [Rhizobium sp. SG_E_25_P2]MDH6266474.1 exopolysaccharide biosynthesis WecB/TagA/CpsF family protein [Rhizobium sp. SG_E_25_P2]